MILLLMQGKEPDCECDCNCYSGCLRRRSHEGTRKYWEKGIYFYESVCRIVKLAIWTFWGFLGSLYGWSFVMKRFPMSKIMTHQSFDHGRRFQELVASGNGLGAHGLFAFLLGYSPIPERRDKQSSVVPLVNLSISPAACSRS